MSTPCIGGSSTSLEALTAMEVLCGDDAEKLAIRDAEREECESEQGGSESM